MEIDFQKVQVKWLEDQPPTLDVNIEPGVNTTVNNSSVTVNFPVNNSSVPVNFPVTVPVDFDVNSDVNIA